MYQLIYIPRIQDEVVLAQTNDLDYMKSLMKRIKTEKPRSYPHHYIWDVVHKRKINLV